jgi:hypothetical protein
MNQAARNIILPTIIADADGTFVSDPQDVLL